jgi:hypothetical protein
MVMPWHLSWNKGHAPIAAIRVCESVKLLKAPSKVASWCSHLFLDSTYKNKTKCTSSKDNGQWHPLQVILFLPNLRASMNIMQIKIALF